MKREEKNALSRQRIFDAALKEFSANGLRREGHIQGDHLSLL